MARPLRAHIAQNAHSTRWTHFTLLYSTAVDRVIYGTTEATQVHSLSPERVSPLSFSPTSRKKRCRDGADGTHCLSPLPVRTASHRCLALLYTMNERGGRHAHALPRHRSVPCASLFYPSPRPPSTHPRTLSDAARVADGMRHHDGVARRDEGGVGGGSDRIAHRRGDGRGPIADSLLGQRDPIVVLRTSTDRLGDCDDGRASTWLLDDNVGGLGDSDNGHGQLWLAHGRGIAMLEVEDQARIRRVDHLHSERHHAREIARRVRAIRVEAGEWEGRRVRVERGGGGEWAKRGEGGGLGELVQLACVCVCVREEGMAMRWCVGRGGGGGDGGEVEERWRRGGGGVR